MTRCILGIDGGGTKTLAAIVDEQGHLLGIGLGGPANYDAVGIEAAQANLGQAVNEARRQAGLSDQPFDAAFLGLAGVTSEHDHRLVHNMAQSLSLSLPERVGVDHDCRVALAGGLAGRPGIVLIVGTGSSCFGMNEQGEGWRAGGWGHLISDEGSSYWLGIQAMRMAAASWDGRIGATLLTDRVLNHLGIRDMDEISHRIYVPGLTKPEVAALAPLVIETARLGDEVALDLLRQGAQDLADCVLAVARHLRLTDGTCELTLVGGLLQAGEIILHWLREAVLARLPQCRITWPELPPVLGACLLGLSQAGVVVDTAVLGALRHSARMISKP